MKSWIEDELRDIRDHGMYKHEQLIVTPQGSRIDTADGQCVNLCANNYLGLADHPDVLKAAVDGVQAHGFGMASVRFICGTQDIHKTLEQRLSEFLGTEDTILYSSCFDANAGLFETLLGPEDAVISDALNHASIIDGIRLCRAQRKVYKHGDMADLEERLVETESARFRLIATDGVFSMQGDLAPLDEICDLADRYDALVMVDDAHATGFMGPNGRGTAEELGVESRIDVITSTLGKALGGASGGFTTGRREIVEYLRQRSRPYLFSNTLPPPIVVGTLKALEPGSPEPGAASGPVAEHGVLQAGDNCSGVRRPSGQPPHRARHDRGRGEDDGAGGGPQRPRRLRGGVQLPRRAAWGGSRQGPGVRPPTPGSSLPGRSRPSRTPAEIWV